ncbi:hypothetical protein [Mycolicibacterium komossense]|uniref:Uncharacterized protein n=1 Tax=Mycolicibacterium komossense TaxID=1779 RepID=A0ABT3CJM3_9MYCO|nr:hypothetical protein [Mycolicibacterium komossense]MCV7229441.1 hypothetical protein [Mycolicibacterium komossense]
MTISPYMVFEHPTVMQLAAAIDLAAENRQPVVDDIQLEAMSVSGLSAPQLSALQSSWGQPT